MKYQAIICILFLSVANAQWESIGTGGPDAGVYAGFADQNGTIWIGGNFSSPAKNLIRYNPSTQLFAAAGSVSLFDGNVWAINSYGNDVIVGGDFNSPYPRVARWISSSSSWGSFGSVGASMRVLASNTSLLLSGGFFNGVLKWNGTQWIPFGSLSGSFLTIAFGQIGLFAGGFAPPANIYQWTGNSWNALGSGVNFTSSTTFVFAIAFLGSGVVLGGRFSTPAGNLTNYVGGIYSSVGSLSTEEVDSLLTIGNDLYVGRLNNGVWLYKNNLWSDLNLNSGNLGVRCLISHANFLYAFGDFPGFVARYSLVPTPAPSPIPTPIPTPATNPTPSTPPQTTNSVQTTSPTTAIDLISSQTETNFIVGIVVGSVLVGLCLIAIIIVVVAVVLKKKRDKANPPEDICDPDSPQMTAILETPRSQEITTLNNEGGTQTIYQNSSSVQNNKETYANFDASKNLQNTTQYANQTQYANSDSIGTAKKSEQYANSPTFQQ